MQLAKILAGPLLVIALLGALWFTRYTWKPWVFPPDETAEKDDHHDDPQRVKLSEQAEKNLRLVVKEVQPGVYWRKIYLPGAVVDRPGRSDRGIPAPIAGVVVQVYALPGRTIRVDDKLFRLRIASESFQTSQMELYKSTRELEIVAKERKRLANIPAGAIPSTRLLDLEYQHDRLTVLIDAYTQDLQTRQLTDKQIKDQVQKGKFITEVIVRMPDRLDKGLSSLSHPVPKGEAKSPEFELQELKVNLGDHVQAGQVLAYVADHSRLYIEGRALRQEAKILAQAVKEGWPVEAEFNDADEDAPSEPRPTLKIEFLGTTMDAAGLTLPVYVPFDNPNREHRPGEKVLLKISVSKMENVFKLPIGAVVREGPDAYVFRRSGASFDRKPVHMLVEDTDERVVVIANDNSIIPGHEYAHNGAASLNRILKASQTEGGGGHHHDH